MKNIQNNKAPKRYAERLQAFGYELGEGYQIANDMLNVVANLALSKSCANDTNISKDLSLSIYRTIEHAKNMMPTTSEFSDFAAAQKLTSTPQNIELSLPKCLNCETEFLPKHHKQKFCTDNCRFKNWEQRTGKTLPKYKAK